MSTGPARGHYEPADPTTLAQFHANARRGNVDVIADSLRINGQFKPIVVNKGTHTGRPNEVLAGNHTLRAVLQLQDAEPDDPRWQTIHTYVIDVDDESATRIVLADNRSSDLGGYDDALLLDLLESVDHDLDGTGYDYDDVNDLLAATSSAADDFAAYFEAQADEAQGTPQGGQGATSDEEDTAEGATPNQGTPATPAGTQDAEDGPEEIWLALTFSVTVEQRRRIRAVLTEIKNRENLPTQAAALVHAIDSYPGLDAHEVAADTEAELTGDVTGDGTTLPEENTK